MGGTASCFRTSLPHFLTFKFIALINEGLIGYFEMDQITAGRYSRNWLEILFFLALTRINPPPLLLSSFRSSRRVGAEGAFFPFSLLLSLCLPCESKNRKGREGRERERKGKKMRRKERNRTSEVGPSSSRPQTL